MIVGFIIASYSIVANDAIQTLGTFLSSNSKRPWWVLWIFACAILTFVMLYGWMTHGGDPSYGRLAKIPMPEHFSWVLVIPPLAVLILTRFGIPVSTTFLVLTAFAPTALAPMLVKSGAGYAVAFVVAIIVYRLTVKFVERRFIQSKDKPPREFWTVLQWSSTGFLWSQWLIQDLANVFAYMPRKLSFGWLVFGLVTMYIMHAIMFARRGGAIQKIVQTKTNTQDIRSATIIDFIFGIILLLFKEASNVPMSTTWVFLGLLAGREFAITYALRVRGVKDTGNIVLKDAGKALLGLGVSVALAFGLPLLPDGKRRTAEIQQDAASVETPQARRDPATAKPESVAYAPVPPGTFPPPSR